MKTELKVKYLQHLNQKRREGGFTLIELLVVVIIIGILAAVALPSLLSQANKAKQVEARNNTGAMNRAQQAYFLENSGFATEINELGLGIADSQNYTYSITESGSNAVQVATIDPAGTGASLKGYKGMTYTATQEVAGNTEAITLSILCEAANPGNEAVDPTAGASTENPATCGGDDKQLGI